VNEQSRMLENENIGKLLMKLSIPATIGMMVQALYNFVDTVFVGQGVGVYAIAGIAIAFPIQMVVMAVAQMLGIGGASIISRSLGAKDVKKAEKTMGNIFALVLIISTGIALLGSVFTVPLLKLFGATDQILPYATQYARVILMGTIFFSFAMASNNIVRAEGNAKIAMYTMLISAGLNILLDPIFIFETIPLINLPGLNMGIRGAALATVVAQATTAVYLLYYFLKGKSSLKFHMSNLKLDFVIIKEMIAIGSAAFFRQVAGSILAIILNKSLAIYSGSMAIAVYGVVNRLMMFTFMPLFGVVQGVQPIIGYNFGANKPERVKEAMRLATVITTIMSTFGFLVLMIFPEKMISIFNNDPKLIRMGVDAIKTIVLALPLVGFQVVGASYFQAIGKALPSLVLSMSRQVLFLIPLILILPVYFDISGIWASFPLADTMAAFVTFVMVVKEMKVLNNNIILSENNLRREG
jgi:MATE family, multidrug efflux pump